MSNLRYAVFGTGFWSNFQIAGWNEVGGVELVALYNRTISKAEKVAQRFGVPNVYNNPEDLIREEKVDFIDIITEIDAHAQFVHLAAKYRIPVICQKPMAPDLPTAEQMVLNCRQAGIPFYVHENFRWQTPIRAIKKILEEGQIGTPFRARIELISGFPVFNNQPLLKTLEHFIITDLGSHLLDLARFLFGEAERVYCHTRKIHADIRGEDVATIMLDMGGKTTVVINMAYAENYLERDFFPQTQLFIEGDRGSLELAPDYWIRLTTRDGTLSRRYSPPHYAWADPAYEVVHASIVPCNENILHSLQGNGFAETTGEDNLRTMRLVFASYDSAKCRQTILI
jgi:D-apiose dehydrogenase